MGGEGDLPPYVQGNIAHGTVTTTDPATDDGTQTTFRNAAGSWKSTSATVQAAGSVKFSGHDGALDLTISNPSIVVDADGAFLVVDAIDSYETEYNDLKLAELDLTDAVSEDGFTITIENAAATITEAGAALFVYNDSPPWYPAGEALAPVDATFSLAEPTVTVSRMSFYENETATVTVTGAGFAVADCVRGNRPPLSGKCGGAYVIAGKFADNWRPSAGAPNGNRKVAAQKWAVLAADVPALGDAAVELKPDGTFTAELTFSKADLDAAAGEAGALFNYGIYTYPGSGAVNAAWETYTPIGFRFPVAAPTIDGNLNVGSELTAGNLPAGTTLEYQWFANGSRISGATNSTLKLGSAQKGKQISVAITAVDGDSYGLAVSESTAKVAGTLIPVTGQPTITGTPQVGKKLTANGTPVTPGVTKTSRSYQWYADGVAIAKATKSTHTLTAAQVGKEITVTVVLKRSGHATTYSDPSTATTQVTPATFSNTRLPKITGTLKVGKTLTATSTKWNTSSVKVRYNWYATTDGVTSLIQHSTSNKLKLTTADRGTVISVELVATKAGYTPVTTNPVSTTTQVR